MLYRDHTRPCGTDVIASMRDILSHRGPDDAGSYVEGPLGLGHRRLSIIDLGGGHQPMASASGRYHIVYNGEVYNYRQLREELIGRGHRFRTQSDTEVILELFDAIGAEAVSRLNGMFAFAIWDSEARALFLARDRMGVKPLYYAETAEAFVFASEVKALFASELISPSCREEALGEYMAFRQIAGPESLFRGVMSLPPGCTMRVANGCARISRFWSPLPSTHDSRASLDFDDSVRQLSALLEDSVRLRLISDVPVGTFCSGGVDSSLVTALASQAKGEAVNTFSVGFDEADYDESAYARMVSSRYQTVHHQLNVGNAQFSELFPKMIWHNDEPLDFANSVHIFALSQLAKRRVTVVLTGEGSDELFAGYPRYRIPPLADHYRRVPRSMRRLAGALVRDHRLAKVARFAAMSANEALLFNSSYTDAATVRGLCPSIPPMETSYRRERLAATADLGLDPVSRLAMLDQESYLVSILHRQDKMSMAAGIESRVPFMDYRIVELANRMPTALKIVRGTGKAPVKAVARTLLPNAIVDRRKSGFGVPLASWFRRKDGLGERLAALPDSPGARVFDLPVLRRLVHEHGSGERDHSELLWTALSLATWRDVFKC